MQNQQKTIYSRGENVPTERDYVSVPCGYTHEYHTGEKFGGCISCFAGIDEGHDDYSDGSEMWEQVHVSK